MKCAATVSGCKPVNTVMPPSIAWPNIPTSDPTASRVSGLRLFSPDAARALLCDRIAAIVSRAIISSTKVNRRFPNSTYLCQDSVCVDVGAIDPSTHSGQVGQPSPEEVSRTIAPVSTIPVWATKLATNVRSSQVLRIMGDSKLVTDIVSA